MIDRSLLSEIGAFAKVHGIKGEIAAHIVPELMDMMEDFGHIFVETDGLFVPFSITAIRPKSSETVLLSLKNITSQEQASFLTNRPIYIESALLPDDADDDDEGFYLDDLIGFTITSGGAETGVITDYDDSTENVLFDVVLPGGGHALIPASDDLIEGVDPEAKTVSMVLPEGLIDIQRLNS